MHKSVAALILSKYFIEFIGDKFFRYDIVEDIYDDNNELIYDNLALLINRLKGRCGFKKLFLFTVESTKSVEAVRNSDEDDKLSVYRYGADKIVRDIKFNDNSYILTRKKSDSDIIARIADDLKLEIVLADLFEVFYRRSISTYSNSVYVFQSDNFYTVTVINADGMSSYRFCDLTKENELYKLRFKENGVSNEEAASNIRLGALLKIISEIKSAVKDFSKFNFNYISDFKDDSTIAKYIDTLGFKEKCCIEGFADILSVTEFNQCTVNFLKRTENTSAKTISKKLVLALCCLLSLSLPIFTVYGYTRDKRELLRLNDEVKAIETEIDALNKTNAEIDEFNSYVLENSRELPIIDKMYKTDVIKKYEDTLSKHGAVTGIYTDDGGIYFEIVTDGEKLETYAENIVDRKITGNKYIYKLYFEE